MGRDPEARSLVAKALEIQAARLADVNRRMQMAMIGARHYGTAIPIELEMDAARAQQPEFFGNRSSRRAQRAELRRRAER